MAKQREMLKDNLVEFKPRYKGTVFGVRNGSYRAYVFDLGRPPESWEGDRFQVQLTQGKEVLGWSGAKTLGEAKRKARQTVKGRAFRHLLRRMG